MLCSKLLFKDYVMFSIPISYETAINKAFSMMVTVRPVSLMCLPLHHQHWLMLNIIQINNINFYYYVLQECIKDLNMSKLLSVSMDGPNVNWRFFELLQQEYAEQFGGAQLIVVGSCGLHTVHNAVKCGFTSWNVEKLLRALHTIFLNVPARREDFCNLTKSSTFALPFCGHRWVENLPVVERAILIWPNILQYVDAVTRKLLPNPGTSSFDTIEAAAKDPLIIAKLHFFMAVSRSVSPFLTTFQTDAPVLPFIGDHLAELLKVRFSLLSHSIITVGKSGCTEV